MFCRYCGKELSEDAYLCTNCGNLVKDLPVQTTVEQTPQTNGMAVAGFVCSFFIPLLGWIFGGVGISRSAKRNGKGRGLSIAALVISTVSFVINFVVLMSV